jgi:hypothetical protein
MKYAYTAKPIEGFEHRNPAFWDRCVPPSDATQVVVEAGFDHIAKHFDDEGAEVEMTSAGPSAPEDIAKMKKAEVVELLKQNGVEAPEGGVDVLRDQLTAILFPDA